MKKKILMLAIMVLAIASMLVLSASASERTSISYTDASGVTHDVPIVKYDDDVATVAGVLGNNATQQGYFADNSSYVILKASDGSLTAYPTWYIIEPSGTSKDYIAISEIEYGYVNSKVTDKTYDKGAILYIEFPNGMTEIRSNNVFTTYESNVTDVYIPSSVTRVGTKYSGNSAPFNSHKALKRVFVAENSKITEIQGGSFSGSTIEYFQFENLTSITVIDGFTGCKSLIGEVDLSNTKLETLKNGVFREDILITKITLPETLITIEDEAFYGCTNAYLASDFLPKNLTYIGTHFMSRSTKVNNTLIFPVGVTTVPNEFMNSAWTANPDGTLNLVFLGKMTDMRLNGSSYTTWAKNVNVYLAQNTISEYNGSIYSFADAEAGTLGSSTAQSGTLFIKPSNSSPNTTTNVTDQFMKLIFCGNEGKVELSYMLTPTGENITEDRGTFVMDGHTHIYPDYVDCTGELCIVCDEMNYAPHIGNTYVTIAYPDGFAKNGYEMHLCDVCDAEYKSDVTRLPIFEAKAENGYSTNADGTGIAFGGYTINLTALENYNTANPEKKLTFGLLIANPIYIGESYMTNGAVNASKAFLQVDLTDTEYSNISIMVNGFVGDSASISLVISLYAYTDKGSVEFIQSEHTACADSVVEKTDASLYTVTITSVKNAVGVASLDALPENKREDEYPTL